MVTWALKFTLKHLSGSFVNMFRNRVKLNLGLYQRFFSALLLYVCIFGLDRQSVTCWHCLWLCFMLWCRCLHLDLFLWSFLLHSSLSYRTEKSQLKNKLTGRHLIQIRATNKMPQQQCCSAGLKLVLCEFKNSLSQMHYLRTLKKQKLKETAFLPLLYHCHIPEPTTVRLIVMQFLYKLFIHTPGDY